MFSFGGGDLSGISLKRWGARWRTQTLHSGKKLRNTWSSLLIIGCQTNGRVYGEIVYQPLLSASMWVFFLFAWCIGIVVHYSIAQSCLILCDPLNCSMTGFPVRHCLLEFAQTHVRSALHIWCPKHQCQSFQWISRVLGLTGLISLSKGPKILLQYHILKASIANLVWGLISQEIIPYIAIDLVWLWKEVNSGTSCISTFDKNPNCFLKKIYTYIWLNFGFWEQRRNSRWDSLYYCH